MAWKDLTMAQKAGLMKIFAGEGIANLKEIRELYDATLTEQSQVLLSSGGKIHINPENRGKFNATKARTGKTTEELTHSKNPLTRKRAIFAQNAAKWNKKEEGGYLDTQVNTFETGGDKNTLENPFYNKEREPAMYAYLRERGLSHTQASALLGNLAVESWLNADLQQLNGGPAYGLMQAEGERQRAMKAYADTVYEFGSGLSPEEQQQLDYILNKGIFSYTPGEWGRKGFKGARDARKAFLNEEDLQKASDIITNNFLRPGKPHISRRRTMSSFYDDKYSHTFPYNMEEYEVPIAFKQNGTTHGKK